MVNRIHLIEVFDRSLIPAEAEVWITVTPEQRTPTTEVRGRLMGPSCPYASTVEVAYPLSPLPPGRTPPESTGLTMRVVIPEASLWEPESPFLYQGPIELWQDSRRCDRITLRHGLRSLHLGEHGLRVNSRPLTLRGRNATACPDTDALALRQGGYNLLVATVDADTLPLWEQADRYGFFVLGRVKDDSEETRRQLILLSRRASCLGWLIEEGQHPRLDQLPADGLLGLACDSPPDGSVLLRVHFVLGPAEMANLGKPLLVKGEVPDPPPDACVIVGSIL